MCSDENQVEGKSRCFRGWMTLRDQRTVAALTMVYLSAVLCIAETRRRTSGHWVEVESLPETPIPLVVDINHAERHELSLLPGIGPSLAERVLGRRQRVQFMYIEELREIDGIGPKTLDRLRPLVTCGRSSPN